MRVSFAKPVQPVEPWPQEPMQVIVGIVDLPFDGFMLLGGGGNGPFFDTLFILNIGPSAKELEPGMHEILLTDPEYQVVKRLGIKVRVYN